MREIKFRGKMQNGAWVYGSFWDHPVYPDIIDEYSNHRLVDRETVGQFTGLLDSNGKEIYEGDILRFAPPLRWEDNERRVGVVVFKYYAFVVKYDDTSTGLFTLAVNEAPYTVIGNVHDNPELLEVEHD